ncbi:hypothetical protein LG634_06480 [Streptomyces bambusae]|uniref:hypothetical protein n=1 Tax=Streptomyces bambusae TaxID=1550616 RepID=UPI001CFD013F|nr:hypothetical protein [Streptomyces bambusae]MCB5164481.1 hypothetical protein [Streptomyces bambusae]
MNVSVPLPSDPRRSDSYADWARSHGPDAEEAARSVLAAVGDRISRAYPKAGRALDELTRLARPLPAAHLPWFWDTVAHRFASWDTRAAGRAYTLARAAEREHDLPVDPQWRRRNVALLAGAGALPVKELSGHQAWLAAVSEPADAHEEYVRVLAAWTASPGELPADLARRLRVSAHAAGLGDSAVAAVLARTVGAARGKAVPDTLLDGVAALLAEHPQDDEVLAGLLDVFPESRNDAAAWLRVLLRSGAADAVAAGRIAPAGGIAAWLGRYTFAYSHRPVAYGGVIRQPVPEELFDLVARFAPRLRAAGTPVVLHEDRRQWPGLDADLLDLCLAEGIAVVDPGPTVGLAFWGDRSRRNLLALATDPSFGPRLEGTVHAGLRSGGTAITRLPENPGIAAEVQARVEGLLSALAGGGPAAADEAVEELTGLLDRPTATALDGIDEALAALDGTGPLARALRAGLPEELGWPALEEAVAALAPEEVAGVTCTWPVLTVYGRAKAVAVAPGSVRATAGFTLPEDADHHVVHYAGGRFLVSWSTDPDDSFTGPSFWSDRPEDVFVPDRTFGLRPYGGSIQGGLGYQFETGDGGGRHDGERVLRPGGREGVDHHDFQMGDGTGIWSSRVFGGLKGWARVDPVTGARAAEPSVPAFHEAEPPPGTALFGDQLTLAALPPDAPASPLGQDGVLTGCRVLHRTPYAGPSPTEFLLEGIDGRRARYRSRRPGRRPWGVIRMPAGGEDAVLAGETVIRCHAAEDNSLLWEARGFPGGEGARNRPSGHGVGTFPPPAFWHFLAPRDAASSAALRALGADAVRALLDAATEAEGDRAALRDRIAGLLPGVSEPRVADGVVRAALLAADVLRRRKELSRRVAVMRAGPGVELPSSVPDSALAPALGGLLPQLRPYGAYVPGGHPATLTAVAAEGRHLRGEIDDETRRLALPAAPAPWTALLGSIDAVAWRAAVGTTSEADRAALGALLETWAGQPFAARGSRWRTGLQGGGSAGGYAVRPAEAAGAGPAGNGPAGSACGDGGPTAARPTGSGSTGGAAAAEARAADPRTADTAGDGEVRSIARDDASRLPRLLDLVARRGPLALPPEAVAAFARRTGVRRSIATLVLGGLPQRGNHDEHLKALRAAPYKAGKAVVREYDGLRHRLGDTGCRAVLAAGVPEDPAELWEPDGMTAAAARMAEAWAGLLGTTEYVDEDLAAALEADLGLASGWALALTGGPEAAGRYVPGAAGVLVGAPNGGLALHHAEADGSPGRPVFVHHPVHAAPASVVAWALTELPVGDPAAAGAAAVHTALRARMDDPRTLVPLGRHPVLGRAVPGDSSFSPYGGAVLPCPRPLYREDTVVSTAHDDGLFVVSVPAGDVFLRPAALADPALAGRAEHLGASLGLPGLAAAVRRVETACGGGLARMLARAADTPVPPGGHELNPALAVPELVAEAAAALGVGTDAAGLYLQLLALARPTDRNVRRWNGWSPARHKKAQEELAQAGAVETGRRPRAGRTAFVPGPWTELKAPHLPLETAKLHLHGATAETPDPDLPFLRLLPPVPPHELFAEAWRAAGTPVLPGAGGAA